MDPLLTGLAGIGVLFVLLALGVHVGVALWVVGLGGLAVLYNSLAVSTSISTTYVFYFLSLWQFTILPLFIFMGLVAASGGLAEAAYGAVSKWVGRMPGGLAIATVGANAVFATCTGSSIVACTVFARTSAPQMRRQGYDKRLAYGLVAAAGSIGMLIPPSALMVIYGILTEESIGKLLLAGVGPGLLLTIIFSIGIFTICKLRPELGPATTTKVSWRHRILALKELWAVMIVATALIGGIFSGAFTVTEAAAIAASVVLVIVTLLRRLKWSLLLDILKETASISAMVFLIFGGARVFAAFMISSGMPERVLTFVSGLELSPLLMVIAMAVIYVIMGCFLDGISMLSITVPLVYPVIKALGMDPIWYAMIVVVAIEIGLITPPVGLNIYATKGVAEPDVSLEAVFWGALPFVVMMVLCLVLVIAFPPISTWLPAQMR